MTEIEGFVMDILLILKTNSNFLSYKLTIHTPYFTHEGEVWAAFSEIPMLKIITICHTRDLRKLVQFCK